jgi:hypothetical protein
MSYRGLALACLLAGCAEAAKTMDLGRPDGGFNRPDSGGKVYLDAPPVQPDAPPGMQTKTLSQTTSPTIAGGKSIACPSTAPMGTAANNYYRVFDLASFGVTTDFHVSKVSFQIEDCESGGATCATVSVKVGTYSGTPGATLSTGSMTMLGSNPSVTVPIVVENGTSTPGGTVDATLSATIPAGSKLYVEVDAPDGANTYQFYMGANAGGQSGKGYAASPDGSCSPPGATPTDIGTLPSPPVEIDLLLTVTGTY